MAAHDDTHQIYTRYSRLGFPQYICILHAAVLARSALHDHTLFLVALELAADIVYTD